MQDVLVAMPAQSMLVALPGRKPLPTASGNSFSFTAPANARFMLSIHAVSSGRAYWEYYSPIQAGPVTYALPQPSTLAPSAAPVAPATGKVMRAWTPWVRKWEPASATPFNPNQYLLRNLRNESDTQPGAHHYLWP